MHRKHCLPFWSLIGIAFCVCFGTESRAQDADPVRERSSLDADWRFTRNDPAGNPEDLSYPKIKNFILPSAAPFISNPAARTARPSEGNPGEETAYTQPDFNDQSWTTLNLPHDWAISGPFKLEYPSATGRLDYWGIGWYRKHFSLPATDQGREISLDIDGAMSYATVWLNGHLVGGWPYGYSSWRLDLTPYAHYGADNVLAIRLDNPDRSSRWYPGAGIYRHVWLVKTSAVHVAHWGTYLTTPSVTDQAATIKIQTTLENETGQNVTVSAQQAIYQLEAQGISGTALATCSQEVAISANASTTSTDQLVLPNPRRWSLESPQRYVVVTTLSQDGKELDRYETPFGVRTLEFTADHGFLLNGKRVPIQGVCDHLDLGALGDALNTRALQRQIEILKAMGCNAIRTSHNPPSPELLNLCDQMGVMVMDEAFDCWGMGKTQKDYHLLYPAWHEADLRALIRRDRNHPCVILWSIGNEIHEQPTPNGPKVAAELRDIVHSEDLTRPVTAACNRAESGFNGFQESLDVFGYNYKPTLYAKFHQAHPEKPLFGSETASCISSRGEYFFPVSDNKLEGRANFQVSSYDLCAPPWAYSPDVEFAAQDKNPFVLGEFVWTGFDYLGEPTPYNDDMTNLSNFSNAADQAKAKKELEELGKIKPPSRSSYFGIIDLAGFPKDRYYLYQAHWRPDFPMAHLLPHWTWPERVGQITPVHVYTSGDSAELFLNGKSLGLRKKGPYEYRLRWDDVIYQPGELKVVAYKNGQVWATDVMRTADAPAQILLQPDHAVIQADGQDLSFVTVKVADKNGVTAPQAKNHLTFSVQGPGEILGVDNGDATSFESFQAHEHDADNGLALVIIRSRAGEPGPITLQAQSAGLETANVTIQAKN